MKKQTIRCPYCGSPAVLRDASYVYGSNAFEGKLYVCGHYPACDSYVAAHKKTRLPMGTLADPELRRRRVQAHAAFDRLWQSGLMTKRQAYLWLRAKLDLPEQEAHIGKFSILRCELVIQLCETRFRPANRAA